MGCRFTGGNEKASAGEVKAGRLRIGRRSTTSTDRMTRAMGPGRTEVKCRCSIDSVDSAALRQSGPGRKNRYLPSVPDDASDWSRRRDSSHR